MKANDVPSYSDAASQALLASHRLGQKLDLLRDMERKFWRDRPEATPAEHDAWREMTRREIGL